MSSRVMRVVALSHEIRSLGDVYVDKEVARSLTAVARVTATRETNPLTVVDTRGNIDLERVLPLDTTVAAAGNAFVDDDLAGAAAVDAHLLAHHPAEQALAHSLDLAEAATGRAGLQLGSWLGSPTLAVLTGVGRCVGDLAGDADGGVGERELYLDQNV